MGHTVTRLQEDNLTPDDLTKALESDPGDLFLFTRTWGQTVQASHLDLLRARGVPTVSYHLDLYLPLARNGGIDSDPFWRTDWVFTPDGDPRSVAEFARRGINHRWMPPAVVADECYLAAGVQPSRDVVFVGSGPEYHSEWPYRGELLGWLDKTYGPRFRQYGGRCRPRRGHQLNRLYAGTKVAVGDALCLMRDGIRWRTYTSDRRYEAPGRGAFQIFPRIDGLGDGFKDGANTVLYDYGDWDGLRERIDFYLANDAERERIRAAGHEHVKTHHTYGQRLARMFEILRAEGALQ